MLRPDSNIAVFLPNPLGDVVMSTPALRAIRLSMPKARIVHVGRPPALETLAGAELADETIADGSRGRLRGALHFLAQLHRRHFDVGVLMPNSFRSAAMARLGGVAPLVGYARDGRSWLLRHRLEPPRDGRRRRPLPMIDYYLALAEALGCQSAGRHMQLAASEAGDSQADALLAEARWDAAGPLVMLNPGAAYGPSKHWLSERWAQLADTLVERCGAGIVLNAAPPERPLAAEIQALMRREPIVSFAQRNNTITLLKSLIRRCRLVVTTDTGARHFAAALDTPVVTLFGSTDPVWAQIDYARELQVRRADACPQSPCQQKQCPLPPGDAHHRCMRAIGIEQVLSAACALLGHPPCGSGGPDGGQLVSAPPCEPRGQA